MTIKRVLHIKARLAKPGAGSLIVTVLLALAVLVVSAVSFVGQAEAEAEAKPFGIAKFSVQTIRGTKEIDSLAGERFENEAEPFTQAGGHPWAWTVNIEYTQEIAFEGKDPTPTRDPKDVVVDLPAGFLGNPTATPRCPLSEATGSGGNCPASTQIGEIAILFYGDKSERGPIYNLVPEADQSAEFGLKLAGVFILLTGHVVHTAAGYGLTGVTNDIPVTGLSRTELTFWGVPADPSHDAERSLVCSSVQNGPNFEYPEACEDGGVASDAPLTPAWTMPADCAVGPETATISADSWEEPGRYVEAQSTLPAMTGCNLLQFDPSMEVQPDTLGSDEPVGLGINLLVPQVESSDTSVTPQLRDTVLSFPEGLSISPGIVDGIQACNESGPEGINFTGPESEEVGLNGELQLAAGRCPDASIVGTAEAVTPLLNVPVKGHVYLARPLCGGPGEEACTEADALDGRLYRLYLELGGTGALADTGVNLKVAFDTEANPATGQLTTKVENTPQLPFSELKIDLNGGPRAPLDNPAVCGSATSTADFTPWSAPGITPEGISVPGTGDATPSSSYEVEGCANPPGLKAGFTAGTVTPQAGQFSSFTLNLSRQDREQYIKGIQIHTPPGLLGMLSSVPLCTEPAANEGSCSESAKIGTTRVASGAGSHPFEIEGSVYLTGPYDGAPFGLSIVTHAIAGPFNLGLVIVRARIAVNPENSTLTITTDETGPHAIPQILDGVPLRLQRVSVDIDRPGFMFNPTNCSAQQITAIVSGSEEASSSVASPFAVGGCKSLAFKPTFKVSTSGHTSRGDGASLDVKLSYPTNSIGNEANIAKVKVDLPKQLPSRLTTLQKACTAATFESNPAACPPASIVGIVKASTPLLSVGLSGPVYFVSHGGEEFPSLVVVLQGEGVRVDLTGSTYIDKAGITSSTFKSIPDVPVGTFELYLPEGKYSALAANGDLCTSKLAMPTAFTAQNGAEIHESTPINVTGCAKTKQTQKSKKAKKAANTANRRASK